MGGGHSGLGQLWQGQGKALSEKNSLDQMQGGGAGGRQRQQGAKTEKAELQPGQRAGDLPWTSPGSAVPSPREGHRSSERLSNSPRSHSWMSAQAGLKSRSACISLTS